MKRTLIAGLFALSASVACAAPDVSNVVMTQGADRRVTVTYDLAGEDAIVTLSVETNGVPLAEGEVANLSGDVNKVIAVGAGKTIVWEATRSWPNHKVDNARARVTAWSKRAPPRYLVIDLLKGKAANADNLMPASYYTSAEAVPGGVTNMRYKTTHMILRRVDPTDDLGFVMGAHPNESGYHPTREVQHTVHLTKPFYMCVYEFTYGYEYYLVDDAIPAGKSAAQPASGMRWYLLHGTCTEWPYDEAKDPGGNAAQTATWLKKIRTRTGFRFDLPTEAQWEYACRAGTTGALNDGTTNLESSETDSHLDELGLYKGNLGDRTGVAEVGSFKPNGWGFYDMHGNVREWVFDRIENIGAAEATDPVNPNVGSGSSWNRVLRGGSWEDDAKDCRSGARSKNLYIDNGAQGMTDARRPYNGFRPIVILD